MKKPIKHELIRNDIKEKIEEGIYAPDEKIPSENQFCQEYSTSRITVRKAIDALVLSGLLYRIQGVGTFVCSQKNADSHPSDKIVLVLPFYEEIFSAGIVSSILRGIETVTRKEKLSVVTIMEPRTLDDIDLFVAQVAQENPVGIIYCFYYGNQVVEKLKKLSIPLLFLDSEPKDNTCDFVTGADFDSAYQAACLMAAMGYKKIGYFSPWNSDFSTSRLRGLGVKKALEELNPAFNPEWIHFGDKDIELHYDVARHDVVSDMKDYLLRFPDLEGMIVINDSAAFALYKAVEELQKKIPEDFKVISYGDYAMSNFFYGGLTTYNQNFIQYGQKAAELLISRIRGNVPLVQQKKMIHYKLVRRNSF